MTTSAKTELVHLSEAVKRSIVEEFITGSETIGELQKRYRIKGHSAIRKWMRAYGYQMTLSAPDYLDQTNQDTVSKKAPKERVYNDDDNPQVRELKRMLRDSEIKIEVYSRMIDMAEREHKIVILKKTFTK